MKVGLVGFAGSGKSTLFGALTGGRSAGARDPGAGDVAAVTLEEDPRFLRLCDLYDPKKRTPFSFQLHDFPGLPPEEKAGAARRIASWREDVEGLLLVVRDFETPDYFYPRPAPDPARDALDLVSELLLADLEIVTRRVEKLRVSVTKPTPKQEQEKRELAVLERAMSALEQEIPVKAMDLSPDERKILRGYVLLSSRPWALVVSQGDDGKPGVAAGIEGPFETRMDLRVRLEAELMELEPDERTMFMEDLGVAELLLPDFLENLVSSMGMLRFYTVGETEVHVWELEQGATAVDAAGAIHSDLARGFIRAEVVAYDDLIAAGDMKGAKANGTFRLEGKEYRVKDGDVITIRFSV